MQSYNIMPMTTIILTILSTLLVIGTINFVLVYFCGVDVLGNDAYIKWSIGLGWIWYWVIQIVLFLPITIFSWFYYGQAVCIGGPARLIIYTRNPFKAFAILKRLKKSMPNRAWRKAYFPLTTSSFKEDDYKFFKKLKNHTYDSCKVIYA